MSDTGPDTIPLGKAVRGSERADERRAQDIRVIALQAAVTGSQGGMSNPVVVARAKAFEQYILHGDSPDGGRTDAFPGRDYA